MERKTCVYRTGLLSHQAQRPAGPLAAHLEVAQQVARGVEAELRLQTLETEPRQVFSPA
ncbi:hypothetical protein JKA73_31095 [Myxococcus xanthus]|uniref:hypothetical protein n=1 Tax=Myxococcus xanthus TaxID=34 RepID=UPI0019170FD7|nr:hypothetical protein [Myxococcus xanthus]QQR43441.1 hypothetical protein JKA73_31095 [Myxococcus xanthus]